MKKANLLFYACIALNALPVLLFRFFPSMDGPAHLYNAQILRQLWWEEPDMLTPYYAINTAWIPNWTSHIILAGAGTILPAFLAEKLLLLLYVIGLPLAFRTCISRLAPGQTTGTYFIFPFVYNALFCLGFYNLALGMILFFTGLALSIRQFDAPSRRGWLLQMLVFLVAYFTHPFSFTLLVAGAFAMGFVRFITSYFQPAGPDDLPGVKNGRVALWRLAAACCIPLLLLCHFYATQSFPNTGERLSTGEMLRLIKDVRPVISYHYEPELRLTEHLYHLFIGLLAIVLYERVNGVIFLTCNRWEKWKKALHPNDLWMGLAVLLLLALLVIPNGASAGMMSDRLALFFFLFLITWLAVQPFPRWLSQGATAVVLIVNFGLTYRYLRVVKQQNQTVTQCIEASRQIAPGSIVLPLNYSGNWLALHFSNYLGIEKPLLILENYEAGTGWFPLLWRSGTPAPVFDMDSTFTCLPVPHRSSGPPVVVDYIFVLGKMNAADSCQAVIQNCIDQQYDRVEGMDDGEVRLYQRKK